MNFRRLIIRSSGVESGRLIAYCADLLSNYLSQRFIDPVLPARAGVLKVVKNVAVNSQRDELLGIWDGRTLRRKFCGPRGRCLERRFGRVPLPSERQPPKA